MAEARFLHRLTRRKMPIVNDWIACESCVMARWSTRDFGACCDRHYITRRQRRQWPYTPIGATDDE